MQRKSDCKMEPSAGDEPTQDGSSRRQFIRRMVAISAGLTVAVPLGRGAAVTEEGIPESAPSDTPDLQAPTEITRSSSQRQK
jgi:hypothetical protein